MPWLPLYLDDVDRLTLLEFLNGNSEVAFVISTGPGTWIARETLTGVRDGRYCLWHHPSGPLPLVRGPLLPTGQVANPWHGWTERKGGADPTQPYFGPGHPGVIWWNVRTASTERVGGIGMSSFEWIGNHYRVIGSAAQPTTEAWWKRLRGLVKRSKSKLVPREGPLGGVGAEIWAMPSALAKIEQGVWRDANPS